MPCSKELKIQVAALTLKRPVMLSNLLRSLSKLHIPQNCEINFLIIENNEIPESKDIVDKFQGHFNRHSLNYALEPNIGIPIARNRAAREAIKTGCDLLAFIDDDEEPDKNWLINLIDAHRRTNALLLGGPVRCKLPKEHLSFMQLLMFDNLSDRRKAKEKFAINKNTKIMTGNWLCHTSIFTTHNIWFDETMLFTGGEDSQFYHDFKRWGLQDFWVGNAIVYEAIPKQRLSIKYQLNRAGCHANQHFYMKKKIKGIYAYSFIPVIFFKIVAIIASIITFPVFPKVNLYRIVNYSGWIIGKLKASFGYQSSLYNKIDGY